MRVACARKKSIFMQKYQGKQILTDWFYPMQPPLPVLHSRAKSFPREALCNPWIENSPQCQWPPENTVKHLTPFGENSVENSVVGS